MGATRHQFVDYTPERGGRCGKRGVEDYRQNALRLIGHYTTRARNRLEDT